MSHSEFDDILDDFFEDPIYINPIRPQELKLTSRQESLRSRILGDSIPVTPIDYRNVPNQNEFRFGAGLGGSEYDNYNYDER